MDFKRLRIKPGIDVERLSPEAKEQLRLLDDYLEEKKLGGMLTSGFRQGGPPSAHNRGAAFDFVVFGKPMAEVANDLKGRGYRVQFERKGQVNPNQSVATGDHIHWTVTKVSVPPIDRRSIRSPVSPEGIPRIPDMPEGKAEGPGLVPTSWGEPSGSRRDPGPGLRIPDMPDLPDPGGVRDTDVLTAKPARRPLSTGSWGEPTRKATTAPSPNLGRGLATLGGEIGKSVKTGVREFGELPGGKQVVAGTKAVLGAGASVVGGVLENPAVQQGIVYLGKLGDLFRAGGNVGATEIRKHPELGVIIGTFTGTKLPIVVNKDEKGRLVARTLTLDDFKQASQSGAKTGQEAWKAFTDTSRNYAPSALRNLLGVKEGDRLYGVAKAADYISDALFNPGDILTGKGIGTGLKGTKAVLSAKGGARLVEDAAGKVTQVKFGIDSAQKGLNDALDTLGKAGKKLRKAKADLAGEEAIKRSKHQRLKNLKSDPSLTSDPAKMKAAATKLRTEIAESAAKVEAKRREVQAAEKAVKTARAGVRFATGTVGEAEKGLSPAEKALTRIETVVGKIDQARGAITAPVKAAGGKAAQVAARIPDMPPVKKVLELPLTSDQTVGERARAAGEQFKRLLGGLGLGPNYRLTKEIQEHFQPVLEERFEQIDRLVRATKADVKQFRTRQAHLGAGEFAEPGQFEAHLKDYEKAAKHARKTGKAKDYAPPTPYHEGIRDLLDYYNWETGKWHKNVGKRASELADTLGVSRDLLKKRTEQWAAEINQLRKTSETAGLPVNNPRKFARQVFDQAHQRGAILSPLEPGRTLLTGTGVEAVRKITLQQYGKHLVEKGKWAKPLGQGSPLLPGYRQVDFPGLGPLDKNWQVPEPIYEYLQKQAGLGSSMAAATLKKLGIPDESLKFFSAIGRLWQEAVGFRKKVWIANPETLLANFGSNGAAVEIALSREGGSKPVFLQQFGRAARDVTDFHKSGGNLHRSADDIQELERLGGGIFSATLTDTSVLSKGKSAAEVGGAAGKVVVSRKVKDGIVGAPEIRPGSFVEGKANPFNWLDTTVGVHSQTEQVFKLALYRTLKEAGHTPEQAAKLVQKYLFNYNDRAYLLEMADRYGVWVFNAFPLKATELFFDTLVTRPDLVAKYPRLAKLSRQEEGKEEKYGRSPDYRRGPLDFNLGGDSDPGGVRDTLFSGMRWHPFGQDLQEGLEHYLPEGTDPRSILGHVLSKSVFSPEARILAGTGNLPDPRGGIPIAHPGSPGDEQGEDLWKEWIYSQSPGFVRGTQRVWDAAHGKPVSDAMTATAQTPLQAALQAFAGIPSWEMGATDEKREEKGTAIDARASVADRFFQSVWKELEAGALGNPHDFRGRTDLAGLRGDYYRAQERLVQLVRSPRVVVNGKLTAEGRARLTRQAQLLYALERRITELETAK